MFAHEQQHLVMQAIPEDRADAFQSFVKDKVVPASAKERPGLAGRWWLLRSEPADGVVTFAFLFDGGDLEADWDLWPVFSTYYGEEEAQRLFTQFEEMLLPQERLLAGENATEVGQAGWTFRTVPT